MKTTTPQTAVFAMGCFWQPQKSFDQLPGVISTRVGYAGGTTPNPTYHDLGDHTESVEVTYDPNELSYADLLQRFWQWHDATQPQITQYQSAIFAVSDDQLEEAKRSRADRQEGSSRNITTRVERSKAFHEAEDYHQKYLEKCRIA